MNISFVIPLYNEENRINKALATLRAGFSLPGIKIDEVIFVNDGSTDKTLTILKRSSKAMERSLKATVTIISLPKNKGKGAAVRTGMLASTSDYTLFFDADMSTPLPELKKLMPHMQKGVDVIVGTRKNGKSTVVRYQPLHRQLLGKGFTALANAILDTQFTDFTCGFKAFSRNAKDDIFQRALVNRWGYDAEILFLSQKHNYRMQEVPVLWANEDKSKVHIFKDVFRSLTELISIRINNLKGAYAPSNNVPIFASKLDMRLDTVIDSPLV